MANLIDDGYALVEGVLSADECASLAAQAGLPDALSSGTRCLLAQPWCANMAVRLRADPALSASIPPDWVAVQCTYFEKSAGRNWLVPIHQDLSIPVAGRVPELSLRGWSEKEGCQFVQAPLAVLEQMVAVRIHLDECGIDDGPLRVAPGSHKLGIRSNAEAIAIRAAGMEISCTAAAGAALLMRPLVLHASSKGSGRSRRRVLHFVFAARTLPFGLEWHVAV